VSGRRTGLVAGCLLAAFLATSLFLAWFLVDHDYEAEYLALGDLVVRGQLNLYQDEVTGQWVPLPFWVYGVSQVVFGPSLLAGRLVSIALALGVLTLVFALALQWRGSLAAVAAAGLFCTNGLVLGYFATAHFSSLVALLMLLGVLVLFAPVRPGRDLLAMAVFSLVFLVKPHYWPAIPFALAFLLWRQRTHRARLAVAAVALAVPALFFLADARHLKMLAYMPIARAWVAPLGYYSWHTLVEDPEVLWVSDYADIVYAATLPERVVQIGKSFGFFVKRYAVWLVVLGGLIALAPPWRRAAGEASRWPTGAKFCFWLFWYLLAWQFVIVGVYIKQAFAYVGAITPLIALCMGCLFADAWERRRGAPALRAAAVTLVGVALVSSPWVHRSHYLPRTVSLGDAALPGLRRAAARIAALIPAGERRVFSLANPLALHLAQRLPYLRQYHQYYMVFTSARDRRLYARSGLWGMAEIEEWLGADARYAVIEPKVLTFYGARRPYTEPVARIEALLAGRFDLLEVVDGRVGETYRVYRRKGDG
jgi:hypothetical protein